MEALAKLSVVERDAELKSILKSPGALRRGEAGVTRPTEWEFAPDVLILDIGLPGLPGMGGFEVARQLRGRPESKDAVLIALTGYGEAESRLRSQQAGFDHHAVKPADIDFLLSIVSQPLAERHASGGA